MAQVDAASSARGGAMVWVFRILLIAGAAFMVYSWYQPWWSAKVAVIPGDNHLVLHPWGIETVAQVRANADPSMWEMPWFFAPFMWTYLGVSMLALLAGLFVNRRISIFGYSIQLATLLILLVGLSYLLAAGLAFGIGELRASWAGTNFIGKSTFIEPQSDAKIKMVSTLRDGYWYALGAGGVLTVLGLLRFLFVRTPKA